LLWGVAAIARYIQRSEAQTYYLVNAGVFGNAVKKFNRKTIVASKRALNEFLFND
jgi:hypothetical protein